MALVLYTLYHVHYIQVLEALEVDYIDESEVLTIADEENHIDKAGFRVPFVCGCRDLGEALRRIAEGAAMLRTKGEAGTGNVVEAVRHARAVSRQIRQVWGVFRAPRWRVLDMPATWLFCDPHVLYMPATWLNATPVLSPKSSGGGHG
jgi:pyridoxal biosynthesis lyase PdxS